MGYYSKFDPQPEPYSPSDQSTYDWRDDMESHQEYLKEREVDE